MAIKHTNPTKPRWDKKDRVEVTAVAPYNFIPLPEKMVVAQPPPDHDSYQPEPVAYTGWIECQMETCSPTYIRGMLTEDVPDDEQNPDFFSVQDDIPLIPGSSLRGMIRQIVEIVGHGRMRYVSPTPTFTYRAVAAQNDDPLRDPYREIVGAFARNVRAGFLQKRGDDWWIEPSPLPSSLNLAEKGAFLKVKERDIPAKAIPNLLRFNSPDYRPQYHPVTFDVETRRGKQGPYSAITRIGSRQASYRYEGVLVCSGNMMESGQQGQKSPRKNHALILPKDSRTQAIKIDRQAIQDYRDGLTSFQEEELTDWAGKGWGVLQDGAPVFYVPEENIVRYFGHSPNFRIPARLNVRGETRAANPRDFVPAYLRENKQPDLADAIFGWVEEREWVQEKNERGEKKQNRRVIGPEGQRAGRAFFTDARFESANGDLWYKDKPITLHVLSGPKATTFQHYLAQDGQAGQNGHSPDNKAALAHYGTSPNETQIRGYKLYWHKGDKPDIEASSAELKHPKQLTKIKPVQTGVHFRFKVHFENLRPEELGLLWWALALPGEPGKQYRHKVGMGKPLGMGAVAIKPYLYLTNRQARYQTLFTTGQWEAGIQTAEPQPFLDALTRYLLQEQGLGPRKESLLELERLQMLLTMLEWREGTPDWLAKTRYMEIEHGAKKVNEYKERPVLPDPLYIGSIASPSTSAPPSPAPRQGDSNRQRNSPREPHHDQYQSGRREGANRPHGRSDERQTQPPATTTAVSPTPPRTNQPTAPQIGERVMGKVYTIDAGDVYLRPEKENYQGWLFRIKQDQTEGIQYQSDQPRACIVLQLLPEDEIVECKPAPKKK